MIAIIFNAIILYFEYTNLAKIHFILWISNHA